MKIKGVVNLHFLHPDGYIEPYGEPECNDISWANFRQIFIHNNEFCLPTKRDASSMSLGGSRWRIFYGAAKVKQSPLSCWYNPDGIVDVSQDFPTYTIGTLVADPDVFRLSAVIPAPIGSPRTINCLGITATNNGSQAIVSDHTGSHLTLLRLNTPCIQATNIAILVTYDIHLYPSSGIINPKINSRLYNYLKTLLKRSADAVNSTNIVYGPYATRLLSTAYDFSQLTNFSIPSSANGSAVHEHELTDQGGVQGTPTRTFFGNAIRYALNYGVNDFPVNGTFIKNTILAGLGIDSRTSGQYSGGFAYNDPRPTGDTSPIQNVYPQRNTPIGPSNDLTVNSIATMTGGITFNTNLWVDPGLQRLFRINITASGDTGISTYKISKMDFIAGFVGNRWQARTALLPQSMRTDGFFHKEGRNEVFESFIKNGGTTYRSSDNGQYVLAADCTRTMSGVNVYDIITGTRKSLDSAVGLNVTAVSDGETTDQYYFITCANTGLWRVSSDFSTIELITSPTGINKAYQICKKNDIDQTLWVLFEGGLCKLSNPNDILSNLTWVVHNPTSGSPTFSITGLTDAWQNVSAMIIDPDNAIDRFLFVLHTLPGGDTSGNFRKGYVWWDVSTGVATHPGTNGIVISNINDSASWNPTAILPLSDSIRCQNGVWVATPSSTSGFTTAIYRFSYGSSNLIANYFDVLTNRRAIPSVINGISGFLFSSASSNTTPGFFIRNSVISTIPNGTSITSASSYVDFMLRSGASSYVAALETASVNVGNLSVPLIYLPNSNFILTYESAAFCYGVTPFMIAPTHANYPTYKGAFWKEYGWDGASWVLGHAGSKTTNLANETNAVLDNLGVSFSNGSSGISFVSGEFFTFVVGNGLFKDNGVSGYTSNFWISMDACDTITQTGNVPLTPLGSLVDEPVTFTPNNVSRSSTSTSSGVNTSFLQNKGGLYTVSKTTGVDSQLISDQLIPASTAFDFRFKWVNTNQNGDGTIPEIGVATGSGTTYTPSIRFRLDRNTGVLGIYNNTTLLASITNPSVDAECRITRDASNNLISFYDGVQQHAPVVITSRFVILADSNGGLTGAGWWDMKLTYTENRRVIRLGDSMTFTGSYSEKFSGLTTTFQSRDTYVLIGSGSPLAATLDYTTACNTLIATGQVKVACGAGWIVFHDSETANPVSISTVAHYVLTTP